MRDQRQQGDFDLRNLAFFMEQSFALLLGAPEEIADLTPMQRTHYAALLRDAERLVGQLTAIVAWQSDRPHSE